MLARSCSGATLDEFIACPLESADNEEKKREEKRGEANDGAFQLRQRHPLPTQLGSLTKLPELS